jgi:hypothetical protein
MQTRTFSINIVLALGIISFGLFSAVPARAQTPSGLTATAATSKSVSLAWTGSAASYVVQRALLGGSFADLTTVSSATATDTSIDPYTTYQYQVLSVTSSGRSAPSNAITVGPPPAGFTNAAPAPNSNAAGDYGYDLSLVLDRNGDPAFAFVFNDPNQNSDSTATELLFRSWNRALYKWNPIVNVATVGDIANSFRPSISLAFDSSTGVFAIAAENGNDNMLRVYTSSTGTSWTNKATIPSQNSAYGPSLALAGGNLYLAYSVSAVGLQYTTGKLSSDPATWQTTVAPVPANTDLADVGAAPSLALDSSGTPAIAYYAPDTSESYNNILFFWRPTASAPIKVLDSQGQETDVAVKMEFFQKNPRITTYVQRQDAGYGVGDHFVRSDDGGNTWPAQNIIVIPPDGTSSTDYPFDMAIGSQDQGAIFFGQNSGTGDAVCGNPKLSLSTDLTHWSTCAIADPSITSQYQVYPGAIAVTYGGNDKLYLL